MPRKSILCVGQLVADIVVRPVNELPASGRTALVEDLQLLAGGCAANTAAVAAKLGAEARIVAVIGQDSLGDAALADLKPTGVHLDSVARSASTQTSSVIVLVSQSGERSFLYRDGGGEELASHHVSDHALRQAKILHVGGAMKLLKLELAVLLERAKSFGCITTLDTDWDPRGHWMSRLTGALPKLDYLMTNEDEAAALTGAKTPREAAQTLLEAGPSAVVIKMGEHGSLVATHEGIHERSAIKVKVRDTTCAGDSFAAAFLVGLSRDWPLEQCIRLANAAGALCCTQISHRAITSLEETQKLAHEKSPARSPALAPVTSTVAP